MTLPTVHTNGDKAEVLREQYLNAYNALNEALTALRAVETHGRNFYPQGPEAMQDARNEHEARHHALKAIRNDMQKLAEHCNSFCKQPSTT